MKKEIASLPYHDDFYRVQVQGSLRSAKAILGRLFEMYRPSSVVDVGCGRGAWLTVAGELGSEVLKGYDGHWVSGNDMLSDAVDFSSVDLGSELEMPRKYDLCISVEVAEHLQEDRAAPFVRTLCRAADVVLFSAGVPYQRGTHHVNLQWQSYWIKLFDSNGYECLDPLRGAIWARAEIEWWYRQNICLFVNRESSRLEELRQRATAMRMPVYDVVHPVNYEAKAKKAAMVDEPTLRFCLSCAWRYLRQKLQGPQA